MCTIQDRESLADANVEKALRCFARIVADVSDRSATMPRMAMASC